MSDVFDASVAALETIGSVMSGVRPLLTRVLRSTQASGRAPDELSAVSTYLIGTEEDKYITRTLFPRVHDCRLLVHTLHRADREPHPHDHPWDEAVFLIVDGGYTDERWYLQDDGEWGWVRRELRPGMVNKLRAIDYHRAIEVLPDTLTFGVVGRRVQEWGFLVDGVKVPHADYHRA